MSLMALILIIGAPALVSVIDDSMESDHLVPMGAYVPYENAELGLTAISDAPEFDRTYAYLPAADNNGTNVLIMNTTSDGKYVDTVSGNRLANSNFDNGVTRIVINVESGDIKGVYLAHTNDDGSAWGINNFDPVLDELGNRTGTYILDIDQIILAKIRANESNPSVSFKIDSAEFDGVLSWTSDVYSSTTIAYGEIIVGATGVLLIVCAILATPWVGTTGLTVKRRRSA